MDNIFQVSEVMEVMEVMEDPEDMLELELELARCGLDPSCGPPPPLWSLPPPPPPPWLSPAEADCSGAGGCSRLVAVDTQVQLQHTFHNLVIIAVCSALLVITLVFLTACIWRSVSLCPVSTRPINGGYFTKLGERRSLLLEETHPFRLG